MGLDRLFRCLTWVHTAMERGCQPTLAGCAAPRGPERTFPAMFHGKNWRLSGIARYQFRRDLSDPSHLGINKVVEVLKGCVLKMNVLVLCLFMYRFLVQKLSLVQLSRFLHGYLRLTNSTHG